MEVRIGIQHVSREVVIESELSAREVHAAVSAALADNQALELTDEKGGTIYVPAGTLGYVFTSGEKRSGVGFGAHRPGETELPN